VCIASCGTFTCVGYAAPTFQYMTRLVLEEESLCYPKYSLSSYTGITGQMPLPRLVKIIPVDTRDAHGRYSAKSARHSNNDPMKAGMENLSTSKAAMTSSHVDGTTSWLSYRTGMDPGRERRSGLEHARLAPLNWVPRQLSGVGVGALSMRRLDST
jgi:hypothetical protein